jgi:hypothetical protein
MTLLDAARPPLQGAFRLSRRVADRCGRRAFPASVSGIGRLGGLGRLVRAGRAARVRGLGGPGGVGRIGGLGGLAALVLAVAACGGQASVALPSKAAAQAPAAAEAGAPQTPQDQVVAAYTGYWQALGQALDSQNAASAQAILASYAAPAMIPSLISGFETDWARGEIQYGGPVSHILSVRITGDRADVHDCADFSNAGVQSASTGQVIGSLGSSRVNMISTLVLTHGRWLVSNQVPVVLSCVP